MSHEKKLLVDVFQAYFYRKDNAGNRKLVFMSENLTSGGIVSSQENTDVRNGQGNGLFAILPGQKDITVNLTENVFSFEALELNSAATKTAGVGVTSEAITSVKSYRAGKAPIDDATNGAAPNINLANTHKVIKLDKIPVNAKEVSIEINGKELVNGNASSIAASGTPVASASAIAAGEFMVVKEKNGAEFDGQGAAYIVLINADATKLDTQTLKVMPYVYKTKAGKTTTLTIDSKTFAEGGELWLQTIEKDEKQKATAYVYFVFENAMPEGNFEINTVSEVQPNDMTINMRILPNEDGELYRIIREEI